jgi:hypothetical protein
VIVSEQGCREASRFGKKGEPMGDMEQVKALIRLGIGVEDACRYAGGDFTEAGKAELQEYEFKSKIDEARKYEDWLGEVIEKQVERGKSEALTWAMEKKLGRYSGGQIGTGIVNITISDKVQSDIVEEG